MLPDKKDDTLGIADEFSARARDRGDPLLGHRERVMYRLSTMAVVCLLPFSINSFIHDRHALAASVLAGLLWDSWGAAATFYAGAGFCGLTLLGLAWRSSRSS